MLAKNNAIAEDDPIEIGPDATATFDNSASNPTEHASSENLGASVEEEDDEFEDVEDDEEDEDEELDDEEDES